MPNPSGNDFRHARKCQTFRETTFAKRGNAKPFGKRLSPCAEMPNLSGNDFRHARKYQTVRKTTFAIHGNDILAIFYSPTVTKSRFSPFSRFRPRPTSENSTEHYKILTKKSRLSPLWYDCYMFLTPYHYRYEHHIW